jgi:hypothetical protein
MQNTPNFEQTVACLRNGFTTKKDDEFPIMAQRVVDDPPQNPKELFDLMEKHITNGTSFNKGMKKICTTIMADLKKKKLIGKAIPKAKAEPTPSKEEVTPSTVNESDPELASNSTPMM